MQVASATSQLVTSQYWPCPIRENIAPSRICSVLQCWQCLFADGAVFLKAQNATQSHHCRGQAPSGALLPPAHPCRHSLAVSELIWQSPPSAPCLAPSTCRGSRATSPPQPPARGGALCCAAGKARDAAPPLPALIQTVCIGSTPRRALTQVAKADGPCASNGVVAGRCRHPSLPAPLRNPPSLHPDHIGGLPVAARCLLHSTFD